VTPPNITVVMDNGPARKAGVHKIISTAGSSAYLCYNIIEILLSKSYLIKERNGAILLKCRRFVEIDCMCVTCQVRREDFDFIQSSYCTEDVVQVSSCRTVVIIIDRFTK
jgi:hypothetical protein